MTPMKHIRKNIFRLRQHEFAARIGVAQSTVSRWENGAASSSDEMSAIRSLAQEMQIAWNDAWFFEVPVTEPAE